MTRTRMFPTLTLAATACALAAAPVTSARAADVQQASSGNWSGYVAGDADAGHFKSVAGSWVQPTGHCDANAGESTYAAFWVGLGGATGKTALEQDGTEVNCSADGTPSYYAWYELVPSAPVQVDLAVHPGDHMTATTTVDGHEVTETIVNDTTGERFSKTLTMADPDTSSAEWIAEAPSTCQGSVDSCTPLTLTDFTKVNFTGATATDANGHTGPVSDGAWSAAAVTLDPNASTSAATGVSDVSGVATGGAVPTSLTGDGDEFAVSYRRSDAAGMSSATSTGGYGGYGGYGYGGAGYGYDGGGYGGSGYGGYGTYGDGGGGYGYGTSGYGDSTGVYGYPGGYVLVYTY